MMTAPSSSFSLLVLLVIAAALVGCGPTDDEGSTDMASDTGITGQPDVVGMADGTATTGSPDMTGTSDVVGTPDGSPLPDGVSGPGFDQIFESILVTHGCTAGYCHGAGAGGMQLTDVDTAYAQIVGVEVSTPACGATVRVVPGDLEASMLWLRTRTLEDGHPDCGEKMPAGSGTGLSADDAALVQAWILAGAPR